MTHANLDCECILYAGTNVMLHRHTIADTRVLFLTMQAARLRPDSAITD